MGFFDDIGDFFSDDLLKGLSWFAAPILGLWGEAMDSLQPELPEIPKFPSPPGINPQTAQKPPTLRRKKTPANALSAFNGSSFLIPPKTGGVNVPGN